MLASQALATFCSPSPCVRCAPTPTTTQGSSGGDGVFFGGDGNGVHRAGGSRTGGAVSSGSALGEGVLGAEAFMLDVVRRADNFMDPFTLREEDRIDMDP